MENELVQIDVFKLLKVYKRKFFLLLIITIIGTLLIGSFSFYCVKPKYASTAKIYLELNEYGLQKQFLTSRSVIEDIISKNNLDYSYEQVLKMINIENINNDRVCLITVESYDASISKLIVNEVVNTANIQLKENFNNSFKIIEYGTVSKEQSNLSYQQLGIIGGMISLLIMLLYLFFDMTLNEKFESEDEILKYLGLNILSSVPNYKKKWRKLL